MFFGVCKIKTLELGECGAVQGVPCGDATSTSTLKGEAKLAQDARAIRREDQGCANFGGELGLLKYLSRSSRS